MFNKRFRNVRRRSTCCFSLKVFFSSNEPTIEQGTFSQNPEPFYIWTHIVTASEAEPRPARRTRSSGGEVTRGARGARGCCCWRAQLIDDQTKGAKVDLSSRQPAGHVTHLAYTSPRQSGQCPRDPLNPACPLDDRRAAPPGILRRFLAALFLIFSTVDT